jgi:hypothetical protein
MALIGPGEQHVATLQRVRFSFNDVSLAAPVEQTDLDRVTVRVRLQWAMDFVIVIKQNVRVATVRKTIERKSGTTSCLPLLVLDCRGKRYHRVRARGLQTPARLRFLPWQPMYRLFVQASTRLRPGMVPSTTCLK